MVICNGKKTSDKTQYNDFLNEDTLYWEGQTTGRTDDLIINHKKNNQQILVFYREKKNEHPNYSFKFEGYFEYISHREGQPTKFVFRRIKV